VADADSCRAERVPWSSAAHPPTFNQQRSIRIELLAARPRCCLENPGGVFGLGQSVNSGGLFGQRSDQVRSEARWQGERSSGRVAVEESADEVFPQVANTEELRGRSIGTAQERRAHQPG
jgi:hypothetical protein